MAEYIMKEEKDMDGVDCYIKTGALIRCRDCKYWSAKTGLPYMSCARGVMPAPMHKGNDFCSYAERREDG